MPFWMTSASATTGLCVALSSAKLIPTWRVWGWLLSFESIAVTAYRKGRRARHVRRGLRGYARMSNTVLHHSTPRWEPGVLNIRFDDLPEAQQKYTHRRYRGNKAPKNAHWAQSAMVVTRAALRIHCGAGSRCRIAESRPAGHGFSPYDISTARNPRRLHRDNIRSPFGYYTSSPSILSQHLCHEFSQLPPNQLKHDHHPVAKGSQDLSLWALLEQS